MHNSAQLRCFENGNDDFGVEAFWIADAARVGYFVSLNGPLNGHPPSIVRLLCYWYDRQAMCVRWGNSLSDPFHVNNGVRQGGILSPYLFNVYMDDLSQSLNCCKTGCLSGEIMINHLMYADDLVLLSPSATGLRELLLACEKYSKCFNM